MTRTARIGSISASVLACSLALAALASAGRHSTGATTAACATSGLVVWIEPSDTAAGSVFYTLRFTNQSGRTCTLTGYPGVSAVDLRGRQLGTAAARTQSPARAVTLANNQSAAATVQIAQAVNFPAATCRLVMAAGLKVYPPNQRAAKVVPLPFSACSRTGPVYLHVKAVARTR